MPPIKFLLLFVFLSLVRPAQAQEPFMRNMGVSDGLPSQQVYQVYQDKQGFIWLATDRGVSRFDGEKFRNFTVDDGLCDNTVFGFHEDHHDRLWMFTFSGMVSWYENGRIHNPPVNKLLEERYSYAVIKNMAVDSVGNLWFGCYGPPGLYQVDTAGKVNEFYSHFTDSTAHYVWNKQFTDKGLVGLYGMAPGVKTTPPQNLIPSPTVDFFPHGWIPDGQVIRMPSILNLPNGRYAVAGGENIFIRQGRETLQTIELGGSIISRLIADRAGNIWIGLFRGGALRLTPDEQGRYEVSGHFLENLSISAVLEDREGAFWFSTLYTGIFYAPELKTRSFFPDQYRFSHITRIGEEVFGGTVEGELIQLAPDPPQVVEVSTNAPKDEYFLVTSTPNRSLLISRGLEVLVRDKKSGTFGVFWDKPARSISFTDKGHWMATVQFFAYFEGGKRLLSSRGLGHRIRIQCILPKKTDEVLVGSMSGLLEFDRKEVRRVTGHPLFEKAVNKALWLPSGELVVGTKSHGLLIKKGDDYQVLNKTNGLLSNNCHDLKTDSSGSLWMASEQGMQELRPKGDFPYEWEGITYTDEDGLCSRLVNELAIQGDIIWAATSKGVSAVQRKKTQKEPEFPVLLDRFEVNGQDTTFSESMQLQPGENNLGFQFVALTFKSLQRPQFLFRLAGLEDTWHTASVPEIRFHKLSPGDYTLQVRLRGVNQTVPMQEFNFTVLTPWWQKTWVRLVGGLLLLALIAGGISWQFAQAAKRNRLQRLSLQSELKALRAQMNPHFLFNSLNSIQHLVSQEKKDKAILAIADFAVLVRKILGNSNKPELTLTEEESTLRLYLEMEKMRFGGRFDFSITLDPAFNPEITTIPSMLLQPFVENAIWHGLMKKESPGGTVTIDIARRDNNMVCTITDDGIGRKAAQLINERLPGKPPSTGLKMMQARIDVLNSSRKRPIVLVVTDGEDGQGAPLGTVVRITIPDSTR